MRVKGGRLSRTFLVPAGKSVEGLSPNYREKPLQNNTPLLLVYMYLRGSAPRGARAGCSPLPLLLQVLVEHVHDLRVDHVVEPGEEPLLSVTDHGRHVAVPALHHRHLAAFAEAA